MTKVHFGVTIPQIKRTWDESKRAALAVEEMGFDSIWVNDHLYFDGILDDVVVEQEQEQEHEDGVPYYDFDHDRVEDFMESVDLSDPHHTAHAWVMVLAYLLADYRILYL